MAVIRMNIKSIQERKNSELQLRILILGPPLCLPGHGCCGPKVCFHDPFQLLATYLHVIAIECFKNQPASVIQCLQPKPILLVDWSVFQQSDVLTGGIDLGEPATLFWYHSRVVLEHEHCELVERAQVLFVGLILERPLIVDVCK